jgi:transposase
MAGKLLAEGQGIRAVARTVGAAPSSVKRWQDLLKKRGPAGLKAKPHPGRRPRLAKRQKQQLVHLLRRGPLAAGYATDLWTCPRVAQVIAQRFGVRYHPDHIWRLLRALGWSCQKPERRARERDEAAIQRWRQHDWPRIKKRPAAGAQPGSAR